MIAVFADAHIKKNTYSRQSRAEGFALTAGDLEILRQVMEHCFLRCEQLSELVRRHKKRTHRRLLKLSRRGYLTTLRFPQQKFIYGLGRAGIQALIEQQTASSNLLNERLRTRELKELFLKHEMMLVDIHVLLTVASRQGMVRLAGWRQGRQTYDSVSALNSNGTDRLPIRPDALFCLQDSRRPEGANCTHFALEADRSTANHSRFADKIRGYWRYIEDGLHERKLGVKRFRVVTVALTAARAENLSVLVRKVLPERSWKYFFFGSLEEFSIANPSPIFDAIWISPRTPGRQFLVPAPLPLHKESGMLEMG